MKKAIIILLVVLSLFPLTVNAETVNYDDLSIKELLSLQHQQTEDMMLIAQKIIDRKAGENNNKADFLYANNGKEVKITLYKGTSDIVVIPDEIDGVPVTQIGDGAFSVKNTGIDIKKVIFPKHLQIIGKGSFSDNTLDQILIFPESLEKIDETAFSDGQYTGIIITSKNCIIDDAFDSIIKHKLEVLYIQDGASVELSGSCFFGQSKLKYAIIPASVTKIDEDAFYSCNFLTIITTKGSYAESYAKENLIPCDTDNYARYVALYEAMIPE